MTATLVTRPDDLGVVIGIAGIIVAFVFYIRSKRSVRPIFSAVDDTLIGRAQKNFPEPVEIRYNNQAIPTLNKYQVVFWNRGRQPLDHSDIASSDPISFHFTGEDVRVLDVRSVKVTRDTLNLSITQSENDVLVSFDFLDQNDGVSFEVFYTGTSAKITCSGTIKGAKEGVSRSDYRAASLYLWGRPIRFDSDMLAMLGLGVIGLALGMLLLLEARYLKNGHYVIDTANIVAGIPAAVFGVYGLVRLLRYSQERIPRRLA